MLCPPEKEGGVVLGTYSKCLTALKGFGYLGNHSNIAEVSTLPVSQSKTHLKPPNTHQGPWRVLRLPPRRHFTLPVCLRGVPTSRPFQMRPQRPEETTNTVFKPFTLPRASNLKSLGGKAGR